MCTHINRVRENENKEKEFLQKKHKRQRGGRSQVLHDESDESDKYNGSGEEKKNNHTGMECDVCGRHVVYSSDK